MAKLTFKKLPEQSRADSQVLPAGEYFVEIVRSMITPSKSGKAKVLELRYQILEGEMAGATITGVITVEHEDRKSQNRGQVILSNLLDALGLEEFHDTEELHNIPLYIKVRVTTREGGGDKNEVIGFSAE